MSDKEGDVKHESGTSSADSGADVGVAQKSTSRDRGNGARVQVDSEHNTLIGKQKAAENSIIAKQEGLNTEHGDVGRAGSYRIDAEVES